MNCEVTIGIATCGRPKILNRCIRSIERYTKIPYKILVLDNIGAFTDREDARPKLKSSIKYIEVNDRKIGCSESNNILAEECDTSYLMHLDDDCYLVSDIVKSELNHLKRHEDVDIVSCLWRDEYYGRFREACVKHIIGFKNKEKCFWKLSIPPEAFRDKFDFIESDEALHSLMLRTQLYNDVKWDNNFEWKGDREDFFLQCKMKYKKIHILLNEYVIHDPKPYPFGSKAFEFNGAKTRSYFKEKWGMRPLFRYEPVKRPGVDI